MVGVNGWFSELAVGGIHGGVGRGGVRGLATSLLTDKHVTSTSLKVRWSTARDLIDLVELAGRRLQVSRVNTRVSITHPPLAPHTHI